MCSVLQVARSGFYAWLLRKELISLKQETSKQFDNAVKDSFFRSKGRYGAPRLAVEMRSNGVQTNRKAVAKSMQKQQLKAKSGRKYRPVGYKPHRLAVAENLLQQDFTAESINQKWVGDITYIKTAEGFLFLAVVIDLFSRRVIG